MNITKKSQNLIMELINEKWELCLTYEHNSPNMKGWHWEVDFTRRMKNGLWDNHIAGVSKNDINVAIERAYDNIKKGRRLNENKA